jgi:uroporphyrinogen III methyltransferase/synthase
VNRGFVSIVGAGPGDPRLLTLLARRRMLEADVIFHDALIPAELLALAGRAELVAMGKRGGDCASTPQDEITARLIAEARAGRRVVRLKGGDPFVFGRGGEEALALRAAGVPFEVVPGVTSAIAAFAAAGVPVTHRGLSDRLTVVTAGAADGRAADFGAWASAARAGSLVVLMGRRDLARIAAGLLDAGLDACVPACLVSEGTTSRQRSITAPLAEVAAAADRAAIPAPAALLVGATAALGREIGGFESRTLHGVVAGITADRGGVLRRALEEGGATVVTLSRLRAAPEDLDGLAREIARRPDWIAFTSRRGVTAVRAAMRANALDARSLHGVRVAAVGPATARALATLGLQPDVLGDATGAALARAMGDLAGQRVLLPQSSLAPDAISNAIAEAGGTPVRIEAYTVRAARPDPQALCAVIAADRAVVTLASGSAAQALAEALPGGLPAHVRIVTIGPTTTARARAVLGRADGQARQATFSALAEAVAEVVGRSAPPLAAPTPVGGTR